MKPACEYRIVDPEQKEVRVYVFDEEPFHLRRYDFGTEVPVAISDGECVITVSLTEQE